MVHQPKPNLTHADVERIVRRDFGEAQAAEALEILAAYGTGKWEKGVARVKVATLRLADGDPEALKKAVEAAKIDYRDVLSWAEYSGYGRLSTRERLNMPEGKKQKVFDADWRSYRAWLVAETRPRSSPNESEPADERPTFPLAKLALARFVAYGIDWSLFALWAGAVLAVVLLVQDGEPSWTDDPWTSQAVGALATTLPFAIYFTWCEMAPRGRTLGKRLCSLRVLRLGGTEPPGLGRALGRTAVKLAPWELGHIAAHQFAVAGLQDEKPPAWSLGLAVFACLAALTYVVMLFVGGGRAPYDLAAGTRVARL